MVFAQANEYYHQRRPEVIPHVPESARTVLDLGCAAGDFGVALMEARPGMMVDGIEPDQVAAKAASRVLRSVLVGTFPEVVPAGTYDAVICNDVLEHMPDPWSAVEALRPLLSQGGVVVASIPNVRFWPTVLGPLVRRGRWDYADSGVLDRTHLRWFTRATMAEMFEEAGYKVHKVETLTGPDEGVGLAWSILRLFARRQVEDLLTKQYIVVAGVT